MNKLAIVGSHPETRELAPFDDPDFDIWVFNEAAQSAWCKRFTASFQMHREELYTSPHNMSNKGHWSWLQQARGQPIYMQTQDSRVPDSVRYPLEEVMAQVPEGFRLATSTASYAMALAVYLGYREIHCYGIELGSNTEYMYQAENFRFWVGFALGQGVNIVMHSGHKLFQGGMYGYDGDLTLGADFFKDRERVYDAEWKAAEKNMRNYHDAIQRAADKLETEKMQGLILQGRDAYQLCGEKAGRQAEAERYAAFGDIIIMRTEFERAAASAQIEGEKQRNLGIHTGGMVEYAFKVWEQVKTKPAADNLLNVLQNHLQHAYDTGAHFGIYKENMEYIAEYDKRFEASGGAKSVAVMMSNAASVPAMV